MDLTSHLPNESELHRCAILVPHRDWVIPWRKPNHGWVELGGVASVEALEDALLSFTKEDLGVFYRSWSAWVKKPVVSVCPCLDELRRACLDIVRDEPGEHIAGDAEFLTLLSILLTKPKKLWLSNPERYLHAVQQRMLIPLLVDASPKTKIWVQTNSLCILSGFRREEVAVLHRNCSWVNPSEEEFSVWQKGAESLCSWL